VKFLNCDKVVSAASHKNNALLLLYNPSRNNHSLHNYLSHRSHNCCSYNHCYNNHNC